MARALGRFDAYGPGPFEVVAVQGGGPHAPTSLIINTEFGPKVIDAVWLGVTPPPRESCPGGGTTDPRCGGKTQG
jgi:hypothetical protein